jgi:hypothetical protein
LLKPEGADGILPVNRSTPLAVSKYSFHYANSTIGCKKINHEEMKKTKKEK